MWQFTHRASLWVALSLTAAWLVPVSAVAVVVVAQPTPVVAYYPTPYPVYYYPYPPGAIFATGFFIGASTVYAFSWHSHVIHYRYDVHEL